MCRALLLMCLALLVPASASAQEIGAAAAGLAASPLHVDPSLRSALTAQERTELTARLRRQSPPVLVALVPLVAGDAVDGDPRQLLVVLRNRTHRTDATFVTVRDGGLQALAPTPDDERISAASAVTNLTDHDYSERVATTLTRFLDALDDPDVLKKADQARKDIDDRPTPSPSPSASATDGEGAGPLVPILIALVVVLLAGTVFLARRRRGARPAPPGQLVLPEHVFEAAYGARRRELRRTVEGELIELGDRLDAGAVPSDPRAQDRYQRALDARDAAGRILDDKRAGDADLVGALVLEDLAQRELGAAQTGRLAPPLCALNPTHGRSSGTARWGSSPPLPVCDRCRRDLRAKRAPDVLEDGTQPYLEGDSVWARTAFGALVSDLPAELVRFHRS